LGFRAIEHAVDEQPIQPGDVTYRRQMFYPIVSWSSLGGGEPDGQGLTLITHGLQGLGGLSRLNLMLVRDVDDDDGESVSDSHRHTLHYAYMPETRADGQPQSWQAAYSFNQPLIPAWRHGLQVCVQLPYGGGSISPEGGRQLRCYAEAELIEAGVTPLAAPTSLLSAEGGLVADLYRADGNLQAVILDFDVAAPVTITVGPRQYTVSGNSPAVAPIELP
jgi:hypothetical protein